MPNERKAYPRIAVEGEASVHISGAIRRGTLLNVSPSGIELECHQQLIERMAENKRDSGLFPDVDLEFSLPAANEEGSPVKSSCNVSYCRRLSQDTYQVGLNFVSLTDIDEKRVSDFVRHTYSDKVVPLS